jgi:4-hydroxy-2-oxoheptanedioate aldolase
MGYGSPTVVAKSNAPHLRERLGSGRIVGTFVKLPATEAIDIVADAGFDFAIVDLEHSQLSDEAASRLVRHASAAGFPAVVRLPACDRGVINRFLEGGADGIQLSSVHSVHQVRDLVAATRYPPHGERSISLAHAAAGYGRVPLREAVAAAAPILVGQIETAETEDPLERILAAGLDVAFVGITDLTVDMAFDQTRVEARVREVKDAAAAAGVSAGMFVPGNASDAPADFRYLALSSDLALLREAANRTIADGR